MRIEQVRTYLLGLHGVVEAWPFGDDVPVFKVMGRMIAYLTPNQDPPWLTVKLDPPTGHLARSTHSAVRPGYHMNKEHWNTILLDGSVQEEELLAWIDESYELVVAGLPKRLRDQLGP